MGVFDSWRRRKIEQFSQSQLGKRISAHRPRPLSPYSSFLASHSIHTLDALYPVHLLIIDHLFALAPTKVLCLSQELHDKYLSILYQRLVINDAFLSLLQSPGAHDRCTEIFRKARVVRFASAQSIDISRDPPLPTFWRTIRAVISLEGDAFGALKRIEVSWDALNGTSGCTPQKLVELPPAQQGREGPGEEARKVLDELSFEVYQDPALGWWTNWLALGKLAKYTRETGPRQLTLRVGKEVDKENMEHNFLMALPMRWENGEVLRIVFSNTLPLPSDPSSPLDPMSSLIVSLIGKDIRSRYWSGLAREEFDENAYGPKVEYCLVGAAVMERVVKETVGQELPPLDAAGVAAYMGEKCSYVELRKYRADNGDWEYRTQEEACRRY
ncbi:hypothetical protein IAT38_002188 [Cryptococcus sp. DSM 104549]